MFMDRDEFLQHVVKGSRLRVDQVKITTPIGTIEGNGILECKNAKFNFLINISDRDKLPPLPVGIVPAESFWKMEGTIERNLRFAIPSLPPSFSHHQNNSQTSISLDSSSIELDPCGLDGLTYKEIAALLDEMGKPDALPEKEALAEASSFTLTHTDTTCQIEFRGILRNFEVLSRNGGTEKIETNDFLGQSSSSRLDTCYGSIEPKLEYALIQREDNIEFFLRSREGYYSNDHLEDWNYFHSFLTSVALYYGKHAWPYTVQYHRNRKLYIDRVNAPKNLDQSPHLPFPDRILANAKTGKIQWSHEEYFSKAFAFFKEQSPLSKAVSSILFYSRESSKRGIHNRITTISLCVLFENLARSICKEAICKAQNKDDLIKVLNDMDISLKDTIGSLDAPIESLVRDTIEGMHNSRNWPIKKMVQFSVKVLNLNWEKDWKDIFDLWKKHRNAILHDGRHDKEDKENLDELIVESRIAGAIHMLVLKLMGYNGIVATSTFEGKFKNI